jgi:transcriptional regulator with XRE-family HTH domain
MYHRHNPKGWDHWSRAVNNSVEFLRKDTAFVPEVRSPTVRRRELGALLRKLRTERGLTVEQAADQLLFSMSKLSRMETGHGTATRRDIRDLCELYEVTDLRERERMINLAREGKQQGWWQPYDLPYSTYVGLEAEAASIRTFQPSVVPGLLQTEEYARAVHNAAVPEASLGQLTPDIVEQRVRARLRRQRLLRDNNPLAFWAVLDEALLHRVVGSPMVMERQLAHIVELAELSNVTLQVIPNDAGAHPAPGSMFNILEFQAAVPDVVYVEGLAGWIYIERPEDVSRYNRVFTRLSEMALDPVNSADLLLKIQAAYRARSRPVS